VLNVAIEDLLRRKPVRTDMAAVHRLIAGRRVLVTGGGGSIGGELCRQLFRYQPAELIILGHGENSIFEIYQALCHMGSEALLLTPLIADIRSSARLCKLLEQRRPQIIFHAAAHKHVPLMELNPAEAITNNVIGTRNLLDAALATGVERFVMISTDKAVNPTSVMGASKRVAELLVQRAAAGTSRPYVSVRFGNVLGSRGSVILTFAKQIATGGPVTVTDPQARRYFMTILEAVQLVLQAAVLGQRGELFVLDMGEPLKIVDLARDLIELSGLKVGRDIAIHFTGMRPGDKLCEEMFIPGEVYRRTQQQKILVVDTTCQSEPQELDNGLSMLEAAVRGNNDEAIRLGLQKIVPEFQPGKRVVTETQRPVTNSEVLSGAGATGLRPLPGQQPGSIRATTGGQLCRRGRK
jgi:FlaA1/EpsC-like NDP-sugar epimerase